MITRFLPGTFWHLDASCTLQGLDHRHLKWSAQCKLLPHSRKSLGLWRLCFIINRLRFRLKLNQRTAKYHVSRAQAYPAIAGITRPRWIFRLHRHPGRVLPLPERRDSNVVSRKPSNSLNGIIYITSPSLGRLYSSVYLTRVVKGMALSSHPI